MKRMILLMSVLVLLAGLLSGCAAVLTTQTTVSSDPTQTQSTKAGQVDLMAEIKASDWSGPFDWPGSRDSAAINQFAAALFSHSASNKGNILVSPASVYLALAMTLNGADTKTLEAMETVLADGDLTVGQINEACRAWIANLVTDRPKTTVSIANSIWFRDGFTPYQPFLQANADYFAAGAKKLDFADPAAKDVINGWVDQATRGLIDEIIEKISPSTVMFLINTVYFKSDWQLPFLKEETRSRVFNAPDGPVETLFMHQIIPLAYLEGLDATGVALSYEGGQFAFFALLPDQDLSPRQWLEQQDKKRLFSQIADLMTRQDRQAVWLSLPKFEAEYDDSLINELSSMGMAIAFDGGQADFSRLDANHSKDLFISEVRHKTVIKVDEKGTEAAAATSVAIDESMISYDYELVFDRPFIYGIMDMKAGVPLFAGILESP